eukprot:1774219-Pyramimonas_sp.AAC.1
MSPCRLRSRRRRAPHRLLDEAPLRVSPSEPLRKGRPAPHLSSVPGGPSFCAPVKFQPPVDLG